MKWAIVLFFEVAGLLGDECRNVSWIWFGEEVIVGVDSMDGISRCKIVDSSEISLDVSELQTEWRWGINRHLASSLQPSPCRRVSSR